MRRLRDLFSPSVIAYCFLVTSADAATKFAGIEIGGNNVKHVQVDFDSSGRLISWVDGEKIENPGLASGGASEKGSIRLNQKKIEETVARVSSVVDKLRREDSVPLEQIAIVGSSGIADAVNRGELENRILEITKVKMNFITAEDEIRLTLKALLSGNELYTVDILDIGSSNTKWGYVQRGSQGAGDRWVSGKIPDGTKTLTTAIQQQIGLNNIEKLTDSAHYLAVAGDERKKIRDRIRSTSAKMTHQTICLSGGAVWAMVTLIKPEQALNKNVRLTGDDFRQFESRLNINPAKLYLPTKAVIDSWGKEYEKVSVKANNELATVQAVFQPEQIVAGGQILLAFNEEFGWTENNKSVVFLRDGFKAWIKGYVKEFAEKKLHPDPKVVSVSKANDKVPSPARLTRPWTAKQITATLISCKTGAVELKTADGQQGWVLIDRLSDSDRRFLAEISCAAVVGISTPTVSLNGGAPHAMASSTDRGDP